jgi:hypothetical protein
MKDAAQFAYMFDNSKSGGKMPKGKKKPVVVAKKPAGSSAPKYQKPEPVKPAVKKVTSVGVTGSKGGRSVVVKSMPKPAAKKTSRSMMGK